MTIERRIRQLNPKEFLEELRQARLRRPQPSMGRSLDRFRQFMEAQGIDCSRLDEVLSKTQSPEVDRAQQLLEDTLVRLRRIPSASLPDEEHLAVGELDLEDAPTVNAESIRAPNGGWLIVMNGGLFHFLYEVARALSTAYQPDVSEKGLIFDPDEVPSETIRRVEETFLWYAVTGRPLGADFAIHPLQMMWAGDLARKAEQFALCHEIAHLLLGHLNSPGTKQLHMGPLELEAAVENPKQEFEADLMGANFLLIPYARLSPGSPSVPAKVRRLIPDDVRTGYRGADFLLQTLSLLEELNETQSPEPETHPPSLERLEYLRRYLSERFSKFSHGSEFWQVLHRDAVAIEHILAASRRNLKGPPSTLLERLAELVVAGL